MLHNSRRRFYHIGQSHGLLCFEPLRCGLWVNWSLFWHPQQWNARVDDRIAQEEENLLTSLSTFQGMPFISSSAPPCCAKQWAINVPPFVGTKLKGLWLLPSFVKWAVNSSEFGCMRYLHSHNEVGDTAKECFSGWVLRLMMWVGFLWFGLLFFFSSIGYSRICIHIVWPVHASGI